MEGPRPLHWKQQGGTRNPSALTSLLSRQLSVPHPLLTRKARAGVRHTPRCNQLCQEPPGPHWSFQPASCSQSQASPGLHEPQGLTLPFKGVSLGAGCGAMRKSPGQAWKDLIRGASDTWDWILE